MQGNIGDLDRSRAAMRRRIEELNRKNAKTAREIDVILKEQARLGVQLFRADVISALLGCFANLIIRTPVDTGRLRAGWQISGNSADIEWKPDAGEYDEFKNNVAAAIEAKIRSLSLSDADVIYIFNNVEYLLALNAGWSRHQAGNFIDLFLEELKAALENAASGSAA